MEVKKAWCFFEQSGTFRDKFKELGIEAVDCDIQNAYGKTDYQIDLFKEIQKAHKGGKSIFDKIDKDDLIFAFFPCIRFTQMAELFFKQLGKQYYNKSEYEKISTAMQAEHERKDLFILFSKMVQVCMQKKLKIIIENPYSTNHYLVQYFPIKAKLIDMDRRERGDYFKKPTQYWFINCEPSYNIDALFKEKIVQRMTKRINDLPFGSKERSEISPEYAKQFIKEFIL